MKGGQHSHEDCSTIDKSSEGKFFCQSDHVQIKQIREVKKEHSYKDQELSNLVRREGKMTELI